MKKLISKFSNCLFILPYVVVLIIMSCTDDDDGNNDPVNPNPDTAKSAVINVDVMSSINPSFGDDVYVGDDGILSSSSGTFWNSGQDFISLTDISDEFGIQTAVDLSITARGLTNLINIAQNELQDSGITDPNGEGFEWQGLIADSEYDLSFYIYGYDEFSHRTTFDLTHAGGKISAQPNGGNTFILPGAINKDYILIENVKPYEISNGTYGFKIDNIQNSLNTEGSNGAIMGFQLKGLVSYQN